MSIKAFVTRIIEEEVVGSEGCPQALFVYVTVDDADQGMSKNNVYLRSMLFKDNSSHIRGKATDLIRQQENDDKMEVVFLL